MQAKIKQFLALVLFGTLLLGIFAPIAVGMSAIVEPDCAMAKSAEQLQKEENLENGRYGDGAYVGISAEKFFSGDGTQGGGNALMEGSIRIIDFAISCVLLPLAILFCMWRTIYLAVFPMIAHTDPLDMLHSGRYSDKRSIKGSILGGNMKTMDQAISGTPRAVLDSMAATKGMTRNTPTNSLENDFFTGAYFRTKDIKNMASLAQHCLKVELRFMLIGLIVVFSAWGIIKLLMQVAIVLLNAGANASDVAFVG